jgi:hypothetical protein
MYFNRGVHSSDHVQGTVMTRTDAFKYRQRHAVCEWTGCPTVVRIGPNRLLSEKSPSKGVLYACGDRHFVGLYVRGFRIQGVLNSTQRHEDLRL